MNIREDTNARDLAALIGPTLLAVTTSELVNLDIWATNLAPVTYLNGTLLFIAGLAIVRARTARARGWARLLSIVGWLAMIAGLWRMFFPEAPQGGRNAATYLSIAALFTIGLVLTRRGYARA